MVFQIFPLEFPDQLKGAFPIAKAAVFHFFGMTHTRGWEKVSIDHIDLNHSLVGANHPHIVAHLLVI